MGNQKKPKEFVKLTDEQVYELTPNERSDYYTALREHEQARKNAAWDCLDYEQQEAVRLSLEAMRSFFAHFNEMYDVDIDTVRQLDKAFWRTFQAFPELRDND